MQTMTDDIRAIRALMALERGQMSWRDAYRASGLPLGTWLDLTSEVGLFEPVEIDEQEEAQRIADTARWFEELRQAAHQQKP